ncbi:MAG: hypothetical protein GY711_17975 [bacterium]|nr:hypothetical protein [bacterium]
MTASDGDSSDNFGNSVSIHGDVVVVGALRENAGGHGAGAAYVYERVGAMWSETAKLTAADAGQDDGFGTSVAVRADRIAVGAPRADGAALESGAVYVFSNPGAGWGQEAKLVALDGTPVGALGESVVIDGDTLISGDPGARAAYAFTSTPVGWFQTEKLRPNNSPSSWHNAAVALRDDTAVIGILNSSASSHDAGAAWVFTVRPRFQTRPDRRDASP